MKYRGANTSRRIVRAIVLPVFFTLVLASLSISPVFSQTNPLPGASKRAGASELTDREIRLLYGQFKEIQSFGIVAASLVGDGGQIGLDEKELTEYLRSKFKEHFGASAYEDISKDSKRFLSLVASRDKKVGNVTARIWVMVEDDLVIYHVKCDAGNFDNPSIWTEEVMGHANRSAAPDTIKKILDEMMKELASNFFKVREREM